MIPPYTLTAILMMLLALFLNSRFNPHFRTKSMFYVSIIAITAQLLMDNLATARGFWVFNEAAILGIYVPIIPIENILFGLALCWFTVLFFELFSKKSPTLH